MNLSELNDSQHEAVLCVDAPSLVIAGAGSGKTRVLTYKIAYLLEQGMKPWNILALTFTNKAAREMRERIGKLVGEERAAPLWMGTFHSIFARILRREAQWIGFDSNFTIYDTTDAQKVVSDIVKEMQLNDKVYKKETVAARISRAKNALMLPSYYASSDFYQTDLRNNMTAVSRIYERYMQRLRQSNAMDFDDLLLYTWLLFNEHPEVANRYQEQFEYVLVDEYQDTNFAQHQIVWQLTNRRQRLSVVGDDAQSIYSFRGANIDNILSFEDRYTGARLFKLEQNYRSTQTIVAAANSVIGHNTGQIHKAVFSRKDKGDKVGLYVAQSDIEESIIVQREVRRLLRDEHLSPSEIAILYRTNAQSRSLEESLRKNNIPYRIYGGTSFYQRKEIKDALAYLRLAVNPHDEVALTRIINVPARGIGQTTLGKVSAVSIERQMTMWDVLHQPELLDVNNGTAAKLSTFVQMMDAFVQRAATESAYTLARDILTQSGFRAEIAKGREPEDITRQENLQELLNHLSSFVEERREEGEGTLLHNYLSEISLLTDMDADTSLDEPRVTLMTVHASKGLEFDAVFVVGMEEDLFPSQQAMSSPRGLEEERRLFYVAMTRARRFLTLSCAKSRYKFGKTEFAGPSRFLQEIDRNLVQQMSAGGSRFVSSSPSGGYRSPSGGYRASVSTERPVSRPSMPPSSRFVRLPSASPAASASSGGSGLSLAVGQQVEHARFGVGTVQTIEGSGMDTKATILFRSGESRKLLLRFAQLKVI
ncbi:MAG: UvrD-helicase domain-containing protein [Bacteroidaceae bacterium]|nr:UvrD-helicase domain-containing protein [Bacteroidaceae bacterium]